MSGIPSGIREASVMMARRGGFNGTQTSLIMASGGEVRLEMLGRLRREKRLSSTVMYERPEKAQSDLSYQLTFLENCAPAST